MSSADTLASADILVVGAGTAGLSTAWELRKRGFSVVVLEQRFPTYGSSGRNPGCLWVQTRRAGLELDLALAGRAKYEEYTEAFGDVFSYRQAGGLFFWESDEQAAIIEDYVKDRRKAGLEIDLLTRKQALKHSTILPDSALGAAFCADDAQIDPLDFISAIEAACTRSGVQIFRNTTALSTLREGDQVVGVRTVRGAVLATGVVWATGAWARTLRDEGVDTSVETARIGQIMLQPVQVQSGAMLHGPRGIHGVGALRDLPSYDPAAFRPPDSTLTGTGTRGYDDVMVLNRGGSLYVGNSIDGRGSLNPHISMESTRQMVDVGLDRYPRYAEMGVMGLWAGLGSETADGLPVVGRVDGVFVNVGHAWGVASGPAAGQVMAEIITGERSAFAEGLRPERPSLTTPASD